MGRRPKVRASATHALASIPCAYCGHANRVAVCPEVSDGRGQLATTLTCGKCDSITEVWIVTKRRRRGARLLALEAEKRKTHGAQVAQREVDNAIIAQRLRAEPGCVCRDGLQAGGYTNGLPTPPQHHYYCPCRRRAAAEQRP